MRNVINIERIKNDLKKIRTNILSNELDGAIEISNRIINSFTPEGGVSNSLKGEIYLNRGIANARSGKDNDAIADYSKA